MASAELDIWRASLLGRIEELLKAVDRLHADLSIILTVEELSSKKTKLATLVESRKVLESFHHSSAHPPAVPDLVPKAGLDPKVAACHRGVEVAAHELRHKLRVLRSFVSKTLSDTQKANTLSRLLTSLEKRLHDYINQNELALHVSVDPSRFPPPPQPPTQSNERMVTIAPASNFIHSPSPKRDASPAGHLPSSPPISPILVSPIPSPSPAKSPSPIPSRDGSLIRGQPVAIPPPPPAASGSASNLAASTIKIPDMDIPLRPPSNSNRAATMKTADLTAGPGDDNTDAAKALMESLAARFTPAAATALEPNDILLSPRKRSGPGYETRSPPNEEVASPRAVLIALGERSSAASGAGRMVAAGMSPVKTLFGGMSPASFSPPRRPVAAGISSSPTSSLYSNSSTGRDSKGGSGGGALLSSSPQRQPPAKSIWAIGLKPNSQATGAAPEAVSSSGSLHSDGAQTPEPLLSPRGRQALGLMKLSHLAQRNANSNPSSASFSREISPPLSPRDSRDSPALSASPPPADPAVPRVRSDSYAPSLALMKTGERAGKKQHRIAMHLVKDNAAIAAPPVLSPRILAQSAHDLHLNIWTQLVDSPSNVLMETHSEDPHGPPVLVAASCSKLVERLTDTEYVVTDTNFPRVFLQTYLTFTTPQVLLQKLLERFTPPSELTLDPLYIHRVRVAVLRILRQWLESAFEEFTADMLSDLRQFTATLFHRKEKGKEKEKEKENVTTVSGSSSSTSGSGSLPVNSNIAPLSSENSSSSPPNERALTGTSSEYAPYALAIEELITAKTLGLKNRDGAPAAPYSPRSKEEKKTSSVSADLPPLSTSPPPLLSTSPRKEISFATLFGLTPAASNSAAPLSSSASSNKELSTSPPPSLTGFTRPPHATGYPLDLTDWRTLIEVPDEELARGICHADFELFSAIRPKEFLGQSWTKPELAAFCPNLVAFIEYFNNFSNWVVYLCVAPETVKDRARMLVKFFTVLRHVRQLKNFSALMAIVAGLNNAAVLRLKHTTAAVPKQQLEAYVELEAIMKSESNYTKYREELRNTTPPVLPFLGVHLGDLVMIDEVPSEINGLLHFRKRRQLYYVLQELHRCQQRPYPFVRSAELVGALKAIRFLDPTRSYDLSLLREPRSKPKEENVDVARQMLKTFAQSAKKILPQTRDEEG